MKNKVSRYRRLFVKSLALLCLASAGLANATSLPIAQLDVENGALIGAQGVMVDGQAYDVTFQDGTCESVYGSCLLWKLPFQSLSQANRASQALADQVFVDSPLGQFDTNPALTRGCTYAENCLVFTPYWYNSVFSSGYLVNPAGAGNNGVQYPIGYDMPNDFDSTRAPNVTIARWTIASAQVPEPSSSVLLSIAGAALLATRRSRRTASRNV